MRWLLLLLSLAFATGCEATPAPRDPHAAGDTEAEDANAEGDEPMIQVAAAAFATGLGAEVVRILSAVRSTRYAHRTSIDEERGTFDVDCSGFVDYALARSAPAALAALRADGRRPLARDYVARLSGIPMDTKQAGWLRLGRAQELTLGDVIAWRKPEDVASHNTGHVVVALGAARERAPGEWVVPIADATAVPHGSHDARHANRTTGIGTATIVLLTEDGGAPIGYRWSEAASSRQRLGEVVLGRPG